MRGDVFEEANGPWLIPSTMFYGRGTFQLHSLGIPCNT